MTAGIAGKNAGIGRVARDITGRRIKNEDDIVVSVRGFIARVELAPLVERAEVIIAIAFVDVRPASLSRHHSNGSKWRSVRRYEAGKRPRQRRRSSDDPHIDLHAEKCWRQRRKSLRRSGCGMGGGRPQNRRRYSRAIAIWRSRTCRVAGFG